MIEMQRVASAEDLAAVAALAREIWTAYFVPIIGAAQTAYMVERFQSAPALAEQLAHGYEYYLVRADGKRAGYCALVPQPDCGRVQLSKIYVLDSRRGQGVGQAIMAFAEARARALGAKELWLTVNRHNAASIAFYEHRGFVKTGTLVQDIGNGFVMDDYRMAKPLAPATAAR